MTVTRCFGFVQVLVWLLCVCEGTLPWVTGAGYRIQSSSRNKATSLFVSGLEAGMASSQDVIVQACDTLQHMI